MERVGEALGIIDITNKIGGAEERGEHNELEERLF